MELTLTSGAQEGDMWKVYVDGSSNTKGSGVEIILENPEGVAIEESLRLNFSTLNNLVEYEALIVGLLQAKEQGARKLTVFTDSQLVAAQIEERYEVKRPMLVKYLNKVKELMLEFAISC